MLILNETVAAGDDIAGRIDRLRHALSLWSRIMVVNKGPAAGAFFCASGSSNMKWTNQPCDEVEPQPPRDRDGGGSQNGFLSTAERPSQKTGSGLFIGET
ncbi:hypothetical protein NKI95_30550, partial [Mesorhizobium sp. M0306]|uniref:hypothetical protein n=1 Tax=Mesorhizobium sp. M0306 TaxID=2956932 RepID=UPI003336DEDA